jgi:hypothetical protein
MKQTKKLLMMISTALLALAFAVPASASAYTDWTVNGESELESSSYEEFSGKFRLSPLITQGPASGSYFKCDATFTVEAYPIWEEGPAQGRITYFKFDTESCEGVGIWQNCKGAEPYTQNFSGAQIDMSASPPSLSRPNGGISYKMALQGCGGEWFNSPNIENPVEITPTLNEQGRIVSLKLDGESGAGIPCPFGTFDATGKYLEEYGELGLE